MKRIVMLTALLALAVPAGSQAQEPAEELPVCRGESSGRALDFWLGEWAVFDRASGRKAGHNLIEMKLDGCAIFEHWTGVGGSRGKSLFYYDARTEKWTQVWVTGNTARPGGLKIKQRIEIPGPGVRFQGRIELEDGGTHLDRTTLTPHDDGTVAQHIEISRDGGKTWQTTFDAIYRPLETG